jgi:hypothetical protein
MISRILSNLIYGSVEFNFHRLSSPFSYMDSEEGYEVTHTTVIFPLLAVLFIAFVLRIQRRKPDVRRSRSLLLVQRNS